MQLEPTMPITMITLLDRFVHQNKIFVHGSRETACAREMVRSDLFRLEAGECAGVSGFWLTIHRKTT